MGSLLQSILQSTIFIANGRLTKDADLRYTASGKAVATFTLAISRDYTNQNGVRESDFVSCVIWGKSAENFANYTRKGSLVGVTARIQTRSYTNNQDQKIYITEAMIERYDLLESKEIFEKRQQKENNETQKIQENEEPIQPPQFWNPSQPTIEGMNEFGTNTENI